MSRRKNSIAKLIATLGVLGLVSGLSAPNASAAPVVPHAEATLSTTNYENRYVCRSASGDDHFTAVTKYNPDGAGKYTAGTLMASDQAFPGGSASVFCSYSLDTRGSFYTINGHGTGFEKLVWAAAATNSRSCPGSFIDNTAIALRNLINNNASVVEADFTDGNLLGQGKAGHGYCLK